MTGRHFLRDALGGAHRERLALAAVLAFELVLFSVIGTRFASFDNAMELCRSSAELGLLALATTLVIGTGGIDLSIGSVMGLAAVTLGGSHAAGSPMPVAVGLALLVGLGCGAANGLAVTRGGMPPLVATLATMALFRGLAEGFTGGYTVYTGFPDGFLHFGQGYWWGTVPPQAPLLAVAVFATWLALRHTPFGRRMEAIGHAPEAARHAGVDVGRHLFVVYTLSGLVAAFAGVLYVAHLGQGKADAGTGYELSAITIVVLGGTPIAGGRATVGGTLLALVAVAVLHNGLLLAGLPSALALVSLGVLLVSAVLLQRFGGFALRAVAAEGVSPDRHRPDGDAAGSASRPLLEGGSGPEDLDMKNSQVAALAAAILVGCLLVAGTNAWLVTSLVEGAGRADRSSATAGSPGGAPASSGAGSGAAASDGATGGATGTTGDPSRRITIGMMPKNTSDPYFASCRKGAEEAAAELGVDLIWSGPNETDAARQNDIVEGFITRGVDVIAVSVENADAISTVLRKARARGIPVITWDADALPDARDFLVNQATPRGIGHALADEASRVMGGEGRYAIITASITAANQNAWIEHIQSRVTTHHPGLSMAALRPSDGLRDRAFTETRALLRAHPDIELFITIAAAAVPGSAEAVLQEDRTDVKVIGLSVPSLCRDYVHQGVIESIVLWNTVDLGYLTVHAATALARGHLEHGDETLPAGRMGEIEVDGDEILLGQPFKFDATNIDDFDF